MKKVNKLFLGVCLAIGLAIAFCGCVTVNPISTDLMTSDVNAENYCVITFHKNIEKIEIDGKRYQPANGFVGNVAKSFILPPGKHRIVVQFRGNHQKDSFGDVQISTVNIYQQVFEREFGNGQYYYIYNDRIINETDPTGYKDPNDVYEAKERRKDVGKKLGIK